jgi:hypothetical protein
MRLRDKKHTQNFVQKIQGKEEHLKDLGLDDINIKMNLKEIGV